MSALALERQSLRHGTDLALEARFALRLRAARMRAGITQDAAGKAAGVTGQAWKRWELGHRTPKLWRVPGIAAALGCPIASLLVDEPVGACVAEVWISAQTIRDVRSGGRAASLDAAERIARQLEPLIWQASTGRLPREQDTPARSRPRRSRLQMLAAGKQATAARTAARLAAMESELQRIEAEPLP